METSALIEQGLRKHGGRGSGTLVVAVLREGSRTVVTASPATARKVAGEPLFEIIDVGDARPRMLEGRSRRGSPRPPLHDCMPAAGAVRSSASDFLRFLRACLNRRQDVLGEALALAQQPRAKINKRLSGGLGWLILRRRGRPPIVWHNGGTWGFRSFAALVPDHELAIVVLSNTTRSVDPLGFGVIDGLGGNTRSPHATRRARTRHSAVYPQPMAATPTPEGIPQRLAAIRAQMSLLADYL